MFGKVYIIVLLAPLMSIPASCFYPNLLKGSTMLMFITTPWKGDHQCGSNVHFNQRQRALNALHPWELPYVVALGVSTPWIWDRMGWSRARPITSGSAAPRACRIPQLLFILLSLHRTDGYNKGNVCMGYSFSCWSSCFLDGATQSV